MTDAFVPRDCRVIVGGVAVTISRSTAIEALRLMQEACDKSNGWESLLGDDRSFMFASLRELKAAADTHAETNKSPKPWFDILGNNKTIG